MTLPFIFSDSGLRVTLQVQYYQMIGHTNVIGLRFTCRNTTPKPKTLNLEIHVFRKSELMNTHQSLKFTSNGKSHRPPFRMISFRFVQGSADKRIIGETRGKGSSHPDSSTGNGFAD